MKTSLVKKFFTASPTFSDTGLYLGLKHSFSISFEQLPSQAVWLPEYQFYTVVVPKLTDFFTELTLIVFD